MREAVPVYEPPAGQALDLYGILEIQPEAELYDIEAAYSRLSSEWGGRLDDSPAEARFRLMVINQAYDTLTSPERRLAYDNVVFKEQYALRDREIASRNRKETRARRLLALTIIGAVAAEAVIIAVTYVDLLPL
jgi:curved DNA-binding protein CbpA